MVQPAEIDDWLGKRKHQSAERVVQKECVIMMMQVVEPCPLPEGYMHDPKLWFSIAARTKSFSSLTKIFIVKILDFHFCFIYQGPEPDLDLVETKKFGKLI